jgi:hypothetical protein
MLKLEVGKVYILSNLNSERYRGVKVKIDRITSIYIHGTIIDTGEKTNTTNDITYFLTPSKRIEIDFGDE